MRILAGATTALRRIVDLGLVVLIVIVMFGVILGKGAPLVGRQSIVIGGSSMEPTIGLGSAIVVKPVDPAALAVGDIVSMRVGPERTTYTHRIVAVVDRADGRWIRTQGDANAAADPTLVPATAVIGKVEIAIPVVGYLLALLSLPMGAMFVLGLAATLLAIAWLLESIEPAPRPARRRPVRSESPDRPTDRPGELGRAPRAATTALDPDPAAIAGEPIAARPAALGSSAGPDDDRGPEMGPGGTGPGSGRRAAWPFGRPAFASAGAPSAARPTVRAQIERNREVRRRRARWQLGRGGPRVTE